MPSRSKKQSLTIVVRPIVPGTRDVTKVVLGNLAELNRHAPLEDLDPIDRDMMKPYKPWKQASRSRWWKPPAPRRNPGRDDGRTWVSRRFVCGRSLDSGWETRDGDDSTMTTESEPLGSDLEEGISEEQEMPRRRREVRIMDLAKPAKPRGVAKEFEMVETVHRVIALEEEPAVDWADATGKDLDLQDWETLDWEDDDERQQKCSYAATLR